MKKYITYLLLFSACIYCMAALPVKNVKHNTASFKSKKKIVFIAGPCSHGPGAHEGNAGCHLLADALKKAMPNTFETVVYQGSWPSDAAAFNNAAAIVLYMDGGVYHLVLPHLAQVDSLMKKGVGLACLHYAVEVPKEQAGNYFLDWIGGYFETDWSINPMWTAEFKSIPKHPVTNGVKPFSINDEWYYHMRFPEGMKNVTPLLTAIPPDSTLRRRDGPHENNPFVRAEAGKPQHTAWVIDRPYGGRGFGFTGGHFHKNWANDNVRKLVLNGIAWIAGVKIPKNGIASPTPSETDLSKNLDDKPCAPRKK